MKNVSTAVVKRDRFFALVALGLILLTSAIYWRVVTFSFVSLDDPDYVTNNPFVAQGLTFQGILWAFKAVYASNWHPMTWLSHMLDVEWFGLNAGGHHLTSALLHIFNTSFLFLLLRRLTGALWRSALVAALFGVHPLHVESVAWVSERKDVLSTLFLFLTIWFYLLYARASNVRRTVITLYYLLALLFFSLGLMSKQMLVTAPFVLLLLDVWPLKRLPLPGFFAFQTADLLAAPNKTPAVKPTLPSLWRLAFEKAPFFFLAGAAAVLAFLAQKSDNSFASLEEISLAGRLENVLISYVNYLWKMFWPAHLSVFYFYPPRPAWHSIGAAFLLCLVSFVALRCARTKPVLLVGWLWYLGTLVPVIGFLQLGTYLMSDRYSYIPLVGIFMMLAWGLPTAVASTRLRKTVLATVVGLCLASCMVLSWVQAGYWKSTEALFRHAVDVSPQSAAAQNGLGTAFMELGNYEAAAKHFTLATRHAPTFPMAHYNLGLALGSLNRFAESAASYSRALKLDPKYPEAHFGLALSLHQLGKMVEAESHCREALRLSPSYTWGIPRGTGETAARFFLGDLLIENKRWDEAVIEFEAIIKKFPNSGDAYYGLARNYMMQGKVEDAKRSFEKAAELLPASMEVRGNFANFLAAQGELDAAVRWYQAALRLDPSHADLNYFLANVFVRLARLKEAIGCFTNVLAVAPNHVLALRDYSWLLATSVDPAVYSPAEALRLARVACDASGRSDETCLHVLAVALSETGQFAEAEKTAETALGLARAHGNAPLAAALETRLKDYRAHRSYRSTIETSRQ